MRFNKTSAMMLRAELPVQRNSTLYVCPSVILHLARGPLRAGGLRCRWIEPVKERRRRRCAKRLRGEKSRHVRRADSRKRMGRRPRQRDGGICERRRSREPVGRHDVGADREWYRRGTAPGAALNDREQPEGRDELAEHLREAASRVRRSRQQWLLEHDVGHDNAGERPADLNEGVERGVSPPNPTEPCFGGTD